MADSPAVTRVAVVLFEGFTVLDVSPRPGSQPGSI